MAGYCRCKKFVENCVTCDRDEKEAAFWVYVGEGDDRRRSIALIEEKGDRLVASVLGCRSEYDLNDP